MTRCACLGKSLMWFLNLLGLLFSQVSLPSSKSGLDSSPPPGSAAAVTEYSSITNTISPVLIDSMYVLGFAIGLLVFGPLTEYIGRRPVFVHRMLCRQSEFQHFTNFPASIAVLLLVSPTQSLDVCTLTSVMTRYREGKPWLIPWSRLRRHRQLVWSYLAIQSLFHGGWPSKLDLIYRWCPCHWLFSCQKLLRSSSGKEKALGKCNIKWYATSGMPSHGASLRWWG